jgi:hypothetical protein
LSTPQRLDPRAVKAVAVALVEVRNEQRVVAAKCTLPAAPSIAILEKGEHGQAETRLFSPRRLSVRMN